MIFRSIKLRHFQISPSPHPTSMHNRTRRITLNVEAANASGLAKKQKTEQK